MDFDDVMSDDDDYIPNPFALPAERNARLIRERVNYIFMLTDSQFRDRFRMTKETFNGILHIIDPEIRKKDV